LPEALDNIRHPYKSVESKLTKILEIVEKNEKYSPNDNSIAQRANRDDTLGGQ
jgi:hypothetical protein